MKVKAYYKDLDEVLHSIEHYATFNTPDSVEIARLTIQNSLRDASKMAGHWIFRVPVLLCIEGGAA